MQSRTHLRHAYTTSSVGYPRPRPTVRHALPQDVQNRLGVINLRLPRG